MAFLFRSILLLMLMPGSMPSSANAEEFSGDAPIALLAAAEPLVENFFTAEHGAAVRKLIGATLAIRTRECDSSQAGEVSPSGNIGR